MRNLDLSPYIQDDIKLTPKLTFNLGVRWDIQVPFTENHDLIVFFDPDKPGTDPAADGISRIGNEVWQLHRMRRIRSRIGSISGTLVHASALPMSSTPKPSSRADWTSPSSTAARMNTAPARSLSTTATC